MKSPVDNSQSQGCPNRWPTGPAESELDLGDEPISFSFFEANPSGIQQQQPNRGFM